MLNNQFNTGKSRPPFKRKDEVTRETIIIALLYATIFALGMYAIIEWKG